MPLCALWKMQPHSQRNIFPEVAWVLQFSVIGKDSLASGLSLKHVPFDSPQCALASLLPASLTGVAGSVSCITEWDLGPP